MESKAAPAPATADLPEDPAFEQIRQEVARLGRAHDNARLDRLLGELETPIVFVDLETTGGNVQLDRITEIGLVEISRSGVDTWTSLVDPRQEIPPFIQDLTGISNEMVRGQPAFEALADGLAARLEGKLFVAHNARFDYGFLQRSFERAGIQFEADMLCTVQLSRSLFPSAPRHGLSALIERFSLEPLGRHRALADADLIWQFWQVIHAHHPVERIQTAIESLTRRPAKDNKAPAQTTGPFPSREPMQQTQDHEAASSVAGVATPPPTEGPVDIASDVAINAASEVATNVASDVASDATADVTTVDASDAAADVAAQFTLTGNDAPVTGKARASAARPRTRRRAVEPLVAQLTFDWGDPPQAPSAKE
jgi:DNA polymerase III epsilon subunit family exonuclease